MVVGKKKKQGKDCRLYIKNIICQVKWGKKIWENYTVQKILNFGALKPGVKVGGPHPWCCYQFQSLRKVLWAHKLKIENVSSDVILCVIPKSVTGNGSSFLVRNQGPKWHKVQNRFLRRC